MCKETENQSKRLASILAEIAEKKRIVSSLRLHLEKNEAFIQETRVSLSQIRDSLGWHAVEFFRHWHAVWLPSETKRQRLYKAAVSRLASFVWPDRANVPSDSTGLVSGASTVRKTKWLLLHCDQPVPDQRCAGIVPIRGWAWAPSGIEKIEIGIDGHKIGGAVYGVARADVAQRNPHLKNAQACGFIYVWDTSRVGDGLHEITITAKSADEVQVLRICVILDQEQENIKYHLWMQSNEPDIKELDTLSAKAKTLAYQPLLSIVMLIENGPASLTQEAIGSVLNQTYQKWELLLVNVGTIKGQLSTYLGRISDPRIFLINSAADSNPIDSLNSAICQARGDFIAFLNECDTISPEALYSATEYLQQHLTADVVYADEDRLDITGERRDPFFKPDWSPDLLRSMSYLGSFVLARRNLMRNLGGFREYPDVAWLYDLTLRLTEKANWVGHIPQVLHHRRSHEKAGKTVPTHAEDELARRTVANFLDRNGIAAEVEPGIAPETWRVHYSILENPTVTIIIPAGPRVELLQMCLKSVLNKTDYRAFDILVIDNSKTDDVMQLVTATSQLENKVSWIDYRNKPFNFSAINNYAVRQSSSALILFLNDDIEVIDAGWLAALVEHGQRTEVGVVGGKLLYPDGLIQHAGVIMGIGGYAGHAFKRLPASTAVHYNFAQVVRNCSAVTAACMLTKRDLFLELGGFNEAQLAVAFQDPDYCLRVREAGYLVVYTPYCTLLHHESASRGPHLNRAEVRYLQRKWASVIANDPYYNPNLTRDAEDYGIKIN